MPHDTSRTAARLRPLPPPTAGQQRRFFAALAAEVLWLAVLAWLAWR